MLCANCGKVIPNKNKFCNNQCQKEYQYKGANLNHGRKARSKYSK